MVQLINSRAFSIAAKSRATVFLGYLEGTFASHAITKRFACKSIKGG